MTYSPHLVAHMRCTFFDGDQLMCDYITMEFMLSGIKEDLSDFKNDIN